MKTGEQIARERGMEIDTGEGIPLSEFERVGLPMVVACTGCFMTMNLFSAVVDDDGYTWCRSCGGEG